MTAPTDIITDEQAREAAGKLRDPRTIVTMQEAEDHNAAVNFLRKWAAQGKDE